MPSIRKKTNNEELIKILRKESNAPRQQEIFELDLSAPITEFIDQPSIFVEGGLVARARKIRKVVVTTDIEEVDYYTPIQETTLERLVNQIEKLQGTVATKQDIINQTNELLKFHEQENTKLISKIGILREMQEANVPHKLLARFSLAFFAFFSISFLSRIMLNVVVVQPFWNNIGLIFSFGFLLMAVAMGQDWRTILRK